MDNNREKNNWARIQEFLEQDEQQHIMQFIGELSKEQKSSFLRQLCSFDLANIRKEVLRLHAHQSGSTSIRPVTCICAPKSAGDEQRWQEAYRIGEEVLRNGKVAIATVCDGTGVSIGFPKGKGMLPVSPVKGKSLFQLLGETIRATEIRYKHPIHWFLMIHEVCCEEVTDFFKKNQYFGLKHVHIASQGFLPMMDKNGRFILNSKHSIAQSANGSGGLLEAFAKSNFLEVLGESAVEILSYCHIENPLLQPFSPHFIGFHSGGGCQISSRCVHKIYADEKMDVFAEVNGRLCVIEHQNLPLECAGATDIASCLRFCLANVDMHLFRVDFLQQFCVDEQWKNLPLHMSPLRVAFVNNLGHLVRPEEANALQLTRNICDLMTSAEKVLLVEGKREEIFSPIRNLAGINSVETAKRDQMRRFAHWLSLGKAELPIDANGIPSFPIEISPLFATSENEFLEKWAKLSPRPPTCENFYLE